MAEAWLTAQTSLTARQKATEGGNDWNVREALGGRPRECKSRDLKLTAMPALQGQPAGKVESITQIK